VRERPEQTAGRVVQQGEARRDVLVHLVAHVPKVEADDLVEPDEQRHLHQQGQAASERVHAVLFVELHHLFVELLAVVLVLLLELLDLGLDDLHLSHRLRLLDR
jgi:hypothetical protein